MDFPRVVMKTKDDGGFSSQNGYGEVTTADLHDLLRLSRETVVSLEAELARRGASAVAAPSSAVKSCIEKMQASVACIRIVQRLDDAAGSLASAAAQIMRQEQTRRPDKIYRQFLNDVLHQCGGGLAVLCSSSLGKRRIVDLTNPERVSLLEHLKSNPDSFRCPVLDGLAVKLGIAETQAAAAADAATILQPMAVAASSSTVVPPVAVVASPNTADATIQPAAVERQIEYKYTEASIDQITLLGRTLASAVEASSQYNWERQAGGKTTTCVTGLCPKNRGDITLNLVVGVKEGSEIMEALQMQKI